MNDTADPAISIPFGVYSSEGHVPNPGPGRTKLYEHTNARGGAALASGLVTFDDMETPEFTIWYDEVLFLHSAAGQFELEYDGQRHPMKVGDVAWIRKGTTVIYRASGGPATLFYAVNPPDWGDRRPA